jgi:Xaa-Pro aminopeptidase
MSISQQEFERRYKRIRELMKRDELDCLLVVGLSDDFNRGNIRYITGSGNGGCCIFPLEGTPVFLVRPYQKASPKLRRTVGAIDLLDLRETSNPPEQAAKELSRFYRGNKVGIVGMTCISVPMYLGVEEKFRERLVDSAGIFNRLRAIKSAEEIEKTRVAAGIADKVYVLLREIIRPGVSEYEIYGEVKKTIYKMGCEYSFDLIDAAGTMMNMSFVPTIDKLESKGTLFFEITPAYEGYYAQLPVTLPVDEYPPHVRKMVSTWAQSDRAVQKILRPGTKAADIYHLLVNTVRENGFISPHEVGHDLGLDAHGSLYINEACDTILESGMVIAIHASVMQEIGGDGCGMGYTYLITDDGAEKLSKIDLTKELIGNEL